MKRRDLVKLLRKNGWWLERHGGNHDIYTNGRDIEPVSHQTEIKQPVADAIIQAAEAEIAPRPHDFIIIQ